MRVNVGLLRWPVVALALVACGAMDGAVADIADEPDAVALAELSGLDAAGPEELVALADSSDATPAGVDELSAPDLPPSLDVGHAVDTAWQPAIPPIDLAAPEGLRTATFALG